MEEGRGPLKHPKTENYHPSGGGFPTAAPMSSNTRAAALLSGGGADSVQNPMMNDVVLKNMFELTSAAAELNNYRRVCKHWRNVVLPVWLKKGSTIVLKDEQDNDKFLQFLEQVHLNNQDDDISGILQYRKFLLEPYNQVYRRDLFELFWTRCGVHLTHLTLKNINMPDVSTFQSILFCGRTPNLEYLVLDIHTLETHNVEQPNDTIPPREQGKLQTLKLDVANLSTAHNLNFPLDWKSLFNAYPKLTHFGIGHNLLYLDSVESASQTDRILVAMMEIRSEGNSTSLPNKLDLKSFNICFNHGDFQEKELSVPTTPASLKQVQSQIETIKLCFSMKKKVQELQQLYSTTSSTLRRLEMKLIEQKKKTKK